MGGVESETGWTHTEKKTTSWGRIRVTRAKGDWDVADNGGTDNKNRRPSQGQEGERKKSRKR